MRTIFALFENYDEAKASVAELIDRHFDEDEMNLIIREFAAQKGQGADPQGTNRTGERERAVLQGIDRVLIDGKSVTMPDVGAVRLAGKIAALTAGAAMAEKPRHDLKDILAGLGVPEELAEFYRDGVLGGSLLFWVRTDDGRAAEATKILSGNRVEKLGNYA